jgi:DNA repair protein RecO (recombination protein O)
MAHHIYTTDAFVLESTQSGEADRFFTLFTRDLGLIRATAKGVRLQKSKLRYSLQDFSRSKVSFVRGKEVWRITSANIQDNLYIKYETNKHVLHVVAHILGLIKRLVAGEQKDQALFDILSEGFIFLESQQEWGEELKLFEIIVVLRILDNLGYLRQRHEFQAFLRDVWSESLLIAMAEYKVMALKEINSSLKETQL